MTSTADILPSHSRSVSRSRSTFNFLVGKTLSPFRFNPTRRHAEAWLSRSADTHVRLRARWGGNLWNPFRTGLVSLGVLSVNFWLLREIALSDLNSPGTRFLPNVVEQMSKAKFGLLHWLLVMDDLAMFGVAASCGALLALHFWFSSRRKKTNGPFRINAGFRGVDALRVALEKDPARLAGFDAVVYALKSGEPEIVMERVKAELGIQDARALMLVFAFPDEADAPRGGEADELLSRVAEVINDTSSPSLTLP